MTTNRQRSDEPSLQAPAKLLNALAGLQKRIPIPPHVDEAILRQAKMHLQAVSQRRSKSRWLMTWARINEAVRSGLAWRLNRPPAVSWAVAAVMIVMAALVMRLLVFPGGTASTDKPRYALSPRVDILDAFALARQIERGEARDPQCDLNRDGIVNQQDVALLAAQAVRLSKGSGS